MRAGEGPGEGFLMWRRALSNLEIQKYYENEPDLKLFI